MAKLRKRKCFEKNNHQMAPVLTPKITRKVRVYFRDPYSTDLDSSDDEERSCYSKANRSRRSVSTAVVFERLPHERLRNREPGMKTSSVGDVRMKLVGVRQRKWGKRSAAMRNSFTKSRKWIGTFRTIEEAATAHDGEKEVETLMSKKSLTINKPEPSETSQPAMEAKCGFDFDHVFSNGEGDSTREMEETPIMGFDDEDFNRDLDFGSMINEFGKLYDDYCGVDDLPECDFDFCGEEFAYFDEHQQTLINIPCT